MRRAFGICLPASPRPPAGPAFPVPRLRAPVPLAAGRPPLSQLTLVLALLAAAVVMFAINLLDAVAFANESPVSLHPLVCVIMAPWLNPL